MLCTAEFLRIQDLHGLQEKGISARYTYEIEEATRFFGRRSFSYKEYFDVIRPELCASNIESISSFHRFSNYSHCWPVSSQTVSHGKDSAARWGIVSRKLLNGGHLQAPEMVKVQVIARPKSRQRCSKSSTLLRADI